MLCGIYGISSEFWPKGGPASDKDNQRHQLLALADGRWKKEDGRRKMGDGRWIEDEKLGNEEKDTC